VKARAIEFCKINSSVIVPMCRESEA